MGETLSSFERRARRPMRHRGRMSLACSLAGGALLGAAVCHVACVDLDFADGQFLCDPAGSAEQCPDGQSCSPDGLCRSGNAGSEGGGPADAGPDDTGPGDTGTQDTGTEDACVPQTCLDHLPSCAAELSDGCGHALDCSAECPSPSTCGGGGVAGECGCPAVASLLRAPTAVTFQTAGQLPLEWSTPEAALAQDGTAARTIDLPSGHYSDRLVLKSFQPSVPQGGTILGIVARIWLSTGATNDGEAVIRSMTIDFERDATTGGVEHSIDLEGDRAWPDYYACDCDTPLEFGSENQLWQLDWTVEQMNSPSLSLRIQAECTGGTPDVSMATARVDFAELQVYYRPACPSF